VTVTLIDTGVLYAAIDSSDAHHQSCSRLLETIAGRLLVSSTVLTETSWHVETNLGAKREAAFLAAVASGELEIVDLVATDIARASEIVATYADMRLGFVDASIIALAERLDVKQVATLDRRHFSVVRPRHVSVLTLLPAVL
jgi:predicted nucleic acid-binding protein